MTKLFTFVPQPRPPLFHIALTGHPGSGKSTVLKNLQHLKFNTIDIDAIVKELYKEKYIQELINTQILYHPRNQPITSLDLRHFIQHHPNRLRCLEKLVHPYILKKLLARMKALQLTSSQCTVVEIPLLFETNWHIYFDHVIVIKPDPIKQHSVLKARGWSSEYIDFIMNRFYPYSWYTTQNNYFIENRYDIKELLRQLRFIMKQIKKNA